MFGYFASPPPRRFATTLIIIIIITIIITDLYSAFRSEDTEALDAAQEDYVSLNRWVFKWRLKVRMFSHSRMSAGREFQVDGAAQKSATGQFGVYARNDQQRSIGRAQSPRWYQLAEIRCTMQSDECVVS